MLPGAVGELVGRELGPHIEFGWRLQSDALIVRLAREVLAVRRPDPALDPHLSGA